MTSRTDSLAGPVRAVLETHWDDQRGYCVPNPSTYPHLWLWDSCFHAIVWAHLGDGRAVTEFEAVVAGQLPGGLVPHMRYGAQPPSTWLGPLERTSSLAQPPMFGHAARILAERDLSPSDEALVRAWRGLDWLWEHRRSQEDLIHVVHPWESGNDHAPRWDDWGAPGGTSAEYDHMSYAAWNAARVHDLSFDDDGAAAWSSTFVVRPAAFNAYVAFNYAELATVLDDAELAARAQRVAAAADAHLWDAEQRLWIDQPVVGGGPSARIPLSDGVMGALVTADAARAHAALDQLTDPQRFGSPAGPANVARGHPAYDPGAYWRGAAWPQLAYLLHLALLRWGRHEEATVLARRTRRTAQASGWAEYWNAETGEGLGAIPQSWTGLVLAMDSG